MLLVSHHQNARQRDDMEIAVTPFKKCCKVEIGDRKFVEYLISRHIFWSSGGGRAASCGCLGVACASESYQDSFFPVTLFIFKHILARHEIMVKISELKGKIICYDLLIMLIFTFFGCSSLCLL
jgi:hypothetical protein